MSDQDPQAVERGLGRDFVELFVAPREAFASLLSRSRFWIPLLLWTALTVAFASIWLSRLDVADFLRAQAEMAGKPVPAIPAAALTFMKAWMAASSILATPLIALFLGAVYLVILRFLMGTEVTFKQVLTVVCWSMLCMSIVSTPLTLGALAIKGDWNLPPDQVFQANGALLLDFATASKPLYALAKSFDLFVFYALFLLTTGFAVASKRSLSATAPAVLAPWVLLVVLKVGWAFIMAR